MASALSTGKLDFQDAQSRYTDALRNDAAHAETSSVLVPVILYCPDERSALAQLAGVPLFVRIVKTFQRAGFTRFVLLSSDPERMPHLLQNGLPPGSVRSVAQLTPEEIARLDREPALFVPANGVVDAQFVKGLLTVPPPETGQVIVVEPSIPWPLILVGPGFLASLLNGIAAGLPVDKEIRTMIRQGKVVHQSLPEGFFHLVRDPRELRLAETYLYGSLGTPADSLMDRLVNRRFSRLLTRILVRFPVRPSHVTLAGLFVGLAGVSSVWAATPTSILLGFLLYQAAVVLDHSDGEVARLKLMESEFGAWLDISVDAVIHGSMVLGMASTAAALRGAPLLRWVGLVGAAGEAVSNVVAYRFPGTARSGGRSQVLRCLANREFFLLLCLGFLVAVWFLPNRPCAADVGSGYRLPRLLGHGHLGSPRRFANSAAGADVRGVGGDRKQVVGA